MLVTTHLSASDYKLFKEKAEQIGISEYELAKQGILIIINQPASAVRMRVILTKLMASIAKDIDETKLV